MGVGGKGGVARRPIHAASPGGGGLAYNVDYVKFIMQRYQCLSFLAHVLVDLTAAFSTSFTL